MAVAGLSNTVKTTASPSITEDDRPVRSRAIAWSVAAVIVVECLYAWWTASCGFFWQDDFIDLQALHQLGFGGRLLEQPVFGHFIPGFTLVDYLLSLLVPYQWWLVVLIEVALFAVSLILLDRLLATLFGSSWLCVALIAVAGASFSLVPSLVWWATALEYLVAIPATLLACLFHVRYLQSGQVRNAVFGGVALAVGFAFYDGLFVSVLFIVLMTVLFWPAGPGLHGIVQTVAVHPRAWVCYGVPVALELGWRFAHHGLYVTGGSATAGQALGFVGLSWTQTLIPLTFGVDLWVLSAHAERAVAGLLGQVLFIGFVVGTILRRRSAWRAWVLLGSTFFCECSARRRHPRGHLRPGGRQRCQVCRPRRLLPCDRCRFRAAPSSSADVWRVCRERPGGDSEKSESELPPHHKTSLVPGLSSSSPCWLSSSSTAWPWSSTRIEMQNQ